MEEVGYYAAIAVLIAFGLLAGNRWARSMGHAVLLGLAGTTIAVVTFLCLIVGLAIFSPDGLVARGRFGDRRPAARRESIDSAVLTDETPAFPRAARRPKLAVIGRKT
jgi:hypothetical protein